MRPRSVVVTAAILTLVDPLLADRICYYTCIGTAMPTCVNRDTLSTSTGESCWEVTERITSGGYAGFNSTGTGCDQQSCAHGSFVNSTHHLPFNTCFRFSRNGNICYSFSPSPITTGGKAKPTAMIVGGVVTVAAVLVAALIAVLVWRRAKHGTQRTTKVTRSQANKLYAAVTQAEADDDDDLHLLGEGGGLDDIDCDAIIADFQVGENRDFSRDVPTDVDFDD
eukprot:m.64549 g.64549  ORF g.64549 m.64549 type:complete len:224 (+) comp9726_c0_seq1:140-811(+)